jgi:succinyl-diaminopimelate desuccinylase
MQRQMVEFTSRLCAIPTVNPPGSHYEECCRFLASEVRKLGLSERLVRVPKAVQADLLPASQEYPRCSVVARWDVGARRTLHYNGHYDVVPPTAGWRTDPFQPEVAGRRLIARGAGDMKGSIAAVIFAVRAMMEAGVRPPWNLELSFTPDEETGGELGLGYVIKSKAINPDAAVVCEGTSGLNVGYAHRGVLWLGVTVIGVPGHACAPRRGINAMEKACGLIRRLKRLESVYAKRPTSFRTEEQSQKPATLMMGGICGGGGKTNVIPDRFHFTIDRRINPEEKLSQVRSEIMALIREAERRDRGLKVRVRTDLFVPPGQTQIDAEICRTAGAAVRAVRGRRARFRLCPGFTDMHFLTRDARVPSVMYGAHGEGEHGDGEHLSIPDMLETANAVLIASVGYREYSPTSSA